jgi:hypothetical protein
MLFDVEGLTLRPFDELRVTASARLPSIALITFTAFVVAIDLRRLRGQA